MLNRYPVPQANAVRARDQARQIVQDRSNSQASQGRGDHYHYDGSDGRVTAIRQIVSYNRHAAAQPATVNVHHSCRAPSRSLDTMACMERGTTRVPQSPAELAPWAL